MNSKHPVIHLAVYSQEEVIDAEELDRLTYELYEALKQSGEESVEVVDREKLPEGAKTAELGLAAAVVLELIPAVVPPLMNLLVGWIRSPKTDKVKLNVQVGNQAIDLHPKMSSQEVSEAKRKVSSAVKANDVRGKRLALIIANSEYEDRLLTRLITPSADAQALTKILEDPNIGGFDNVTILVNETASTIRSAIERLFKNKKRKDLLFLYFSGHGLKEEGGEFYLAGKDTQTDLIRATGVSAGFIGTEMDRSYSERQVLVLDCCYSGAFVRGAKALNGIGARLNTISAFQGSGFGRVILAASDTMQYAWEGDAVIGEGKNSIFTHYMMEGLRTGEADDDRDGLVSLDELYHYVYERVRHRQTPSISSTGLQGKIIIARNPNPVVQVADLPEELQAALESPYYWIRKGAVDELGRLLKSEKSGMAIAAEQALERLMQDDSRAVSKAAGQVLETHRTPEQPVVAQPKSSRPPPQAPSVPIPARPKKRATAATSCVLYLLALAVPGLGIILSQSYKNKVSESERYLVKNLRFFGLVSIGLYTCMCLFLLVSTMSG